MNELESYIRNIPDFPKPGIQFKDITPLLANPEAFSEAIRRMINPFEQQSITKVLGIEARGFLFAAPIAMHVNAGIVPLRKPGKLPYSIISHTYDLEYGTDTIEMHQDAISGDDRILIVDDLLATGGTVGAAVKLAESTGATIVGIAFLIELEFLNGRKKINGYPVHSLVKF
ncbi:adenine phosphoribosyltransferase [bacterium]|nr:adenine phosphoribosyltransferase [candidate division CSSED10-310 bacterium]